jgi:energy-coupling factor transport system substrate-specific component
MSSKTQRLNARDLITIGVFNALILVVYIVMQAILQPLPGMGLFNGGVSAFIMAPLYLILVARVHKRGVFFITSVLYSLLVATVGMYTAILPVLLAGVLGDLIAGLRAFRSLVAVVAGYTVFKTLETVGNYSVIVINPERFAANMEPVVRAKWLESAAMFNVWMGAFVLVFTFVGALAGGVLATRILRKHFVKAGLVAAPLS